MKALIVTLALVTSACPGEPVKLSGKAEAAAKAGAPAKESKVVPISGTATAHGTAK